MKVNLFFNYYESETRQEEIDLCLAKNRQVFDEVIIIEGNPTFNEMFKITESYPNDINCFCNSDIYFKSIELLRGIKDKECYALTRWDLAKDGKKLTFMNVPDSQDSWVFKGTVRGVNADFTKGKWGCDNRLVHELMVSGYKVINPSLSIVTVHVHQADVRDHTRTVLNTVQPPYKTIKPSSL